MMDIKQKFIDYFVQKGHQHMPSSSLIPINDESLIFTNSGMVQFKDYFLGNEKLDYNQVVTAQQCIRAGGKHNDLDNVGYTRRHHTFFEMLGNFSFGHYFKDQAIEYAWNFITQELNLLKEKLYVTVYHTDDEAYNIWSKFISKKNIIRISSNDNFWSMAETGPCGPCSEIFYDCGPQLQGGLPGTANQDGDRFLELWNLVFMQSNMNLDHSLTSLKFKSIDTGAGLERLYSVIENVYDNYETSLFSPLYKTIEEELQIKRNLSNKTSFNVIADHMRSISALIANNVVPSNVGRGYVLRRIIRRAMRYNYSLNQNDMILHKLVPSATELLKDYDNILSSANNIQILLQEEQNKFYDMMQNGMKILSKHKNDTLLSGDIAFKLYDTYGFPLDMTIDYMKPNSVDIPQFEKAMQEQKSKSKWKSIVNTQIFIEGETEFFGYSNHSIKAKVNQIIQDNQKKDSIDKGEFDLILNQTVFYAESGGQKGDIGFLTGDNNLKIQVLDTIKQNKIIIHKCKIISGQVNINSVLLCNIDTQYRESITAHHSATHLLHFALKKVLGNHITQQGSIVYSDKLRFDFNYSKPLSNDQINQIENVVNSFILSNFDVKVQIMQKEKAFASGAIGMFNEKYDNEVRVVNIGEESIELCGGTHVKKSGDIGSFYIVKETSISSGIRRIEAVSHCAAVSYSQKNRSILNHLYFTYSTNDIDLKIQNLISKNKDLEQQLDDLYLENTKFESLKLVNYKKTNINASIIRKLINDYIQKDNTKTYIYDIGKMLFIGGKISKDLYKLSLKSKILSKKEFYVEIVILNDLERDLILNLFK